MKNKKILIRCICVLCSFLVCFSTTVVVGSIAKKMPTTENKSTEAKANPTEGATNKETHMTKIPTAPSNVDEATEIPTQAKTQPATEVITEIITEPTTQPLTQPTTQIDDSLQPADLTSFLSDMNQTYDSLRDLKCSQLVVVRSMSNDAEVLLYETNDEGLWINNTALATNGYVGSNGVSDESYEGSYETPRGFFSIGDAFYRNSAPNTGLNSFKITEDTYWVDDPDSKFYNMRVEGAENMDWNSAEHMNSIANYEYGFVINFNMNPIIKRKGSAIFFHIGSSPTAGCVAVSEQMVLNYLSVLDSSKNPYIMIM